MRFPHALVVGCALMSYGFGWADFGVTRKNIRIRAAPKVDIMGAQIQLPVDGTWDFTLTANEAQATGELEIDARALLEHAHPRLEGLVRARLPSDNCGSYNPKNRVAVLRKITSRVTGDELQVDAFGDGAVWACIENPVPRCKLVWRGFKSRMECWSGAPIKTQLRDFGWSASFSVRLVAESGELFARMSPPRITVDDDTLRSFLLLAGNDIERSVEQDARASLSRDTLIPVPKHLAGATIRILSARLAPPAKIHLRATLSTPPSQARSIIELSRSMTSSGG